MKISLIQKEKLALEAEKHVDDLSYDGICALAPRGEFWWRSQSENGLYNMQRQKAVEIITARLIKAATG